MMKIKTRLTVLGIIALSVFSVQLNFGQPVSQKFYSLEVVASTSPNLDVFAAPSINDFGDLAFSGRFTSGGGTVFRNTIGQSTVNMMPGFSSSPTHFAAGRVQINDSGQIIEHSFVSGTTPAQNYLRRINSVDNFTLIAAANGLGGFNDFNQIYQSSITMNNFGEPAFLARIGQDSTILASGIRPNFSTLQFPSTGDSLRPMISDCGSVVVRAGAHSTDPIRLYADDFSDFETIASVAEGFTSLGQSPGISNYCEVVTFYGDLNQVGADAIGTNPGPGIFASILVDKDTGKRRIVRLAGRLIEDISASGGNDDGYCDAGETCMPGELGFRLDGTPIFFSSFNSLDRVAVAHQAVATTGIQDDIFVVAFVATPNVASDRPERPFRNQAGLWTVTTQIKNVGGALRERPVVPVPVVQLGDTVEGRTVSAINVYDQISSVRTPGSSVQSPGDHRLAFHLATNNGNLIIRAERKAEVPVIFIPGITGSRLAEVSGGGQTERWPGVGVGLLTGANITRLLPSENATIVATDAIRAMLPGGVGAIYGPLLDSLSVSGGLREYQVDGNPDRRTSAGCDMSQRFSNPRLFVFAYDWRLSNIDNAEKLADYVGCIQRFYPGTEVDIVAHSMGGLLARRYIITNPDSHYVRKMITIGSPYLGATEALHMAETGRFRVLNDVITKRIPTFITNKVRRLAQESDAVHELFPSEDYLTIGGRPFVEDTFDINGDGMVPDEYTYPELFEFYNSRLSGAPYLTNELFHGFGGQDDWRTDDSGVEYYHIFGRQHTLATPEQIVATPVVRKPQSVVRQEFSFKTRKGVGDGTVPRRSAERCEVYGCIPGLDLNAPSAEVIGYFAQNQSESNQYSHVGLVKSAEIRSDVLDILGLPHQAMYGTWEHQNKENKMRVVTRNPLGGTGGPEPPLGEAYYVTIVGTERLTIADDLGNVNTPLGDEGFELAVPGVSYDGGVYTETVDVGYHGVTMPADGGQYTIKFRTGAGSIDIEVLRGVGNTSPTMAIRYIDLDVPANVECLLTFGPQGVPDLAYDSNGDGTYDVVVPAHVRVTGTAAQDVTAPSVTVTYSKRTGQGRLITVAAQDAQTGVQTTYYRVGETGPYQVYTGPIFLHLPASKVLEAFADDNVGNRSSPVRVVVPAWNAAP